jgi:hypothetical protein
MEEAITTLIERALVLWEADEKWVGGSEADTLGTVEK